MSAQDNAHKQAPWGEDFRQTIPGAGWPATLGSSAAIPHTADAPRAPAFTPGRVAESDFTPISLHLYPHLNGHLVPSHDSLPVQATIVSEEQSLVQETALGFQSQVAQTFPWQDAYLEPPHPDPSHGYGFLPSTNSLAPGEIRAETSSATTAQGVDVSYMTHHTSNPWEPTSTYQTPPPSASRTSGPERSKKSRSRRTEPCALPQRGTAKPTKRAAACWRCRKYRKPCDGEPICGSCQVGNFRVWPPALGCRRDNLEGFALAIIPPSTEDLLRTLPSELEPRPSWRFSVSSKSLAREDLFPDTASHDWSPLAAKVHETGLFGLELVDLLNIVNTYQTRQRAKNLVLQATCTLFSASCDYYNVFVVTARNQKDSPPRENIAATIHEIRASMARSLSLFLSLCVSTKRADWFPSVLSFAIFVASVAMFMDAAVAMPVAARTELWADVRSFCLGLRSQLYPTALDLLRIRANNDKQMAPLKLNCWNWVAGKPLSMTVLTPPSGIELGPTQNLNVDSAQSYGTSTGSVSRIANPPVDQPTPPNDEPPDEPSPLPRLVRNPEGMRLVGNDEAAFDGFAALQAWLNANENVLKQGEILFSNDPFTSPTVAAVCTLAPIFGV